MKQHSPTRFSLILLSALLGLNAASLASDIGITLNSGPGFALWDNFPSTNFTNDAPDSGSGLVSPGLNLASSAFLTGSGSRIYDFGATATWGVTGSAAYNITGFELQVKNYQYTTQSLNGLFVPTLNGLPFDNVNVSFVTEGTNTQEIVTWSWAAALTGTPTSAYNVSFSEPGTHISIDAVAVRAVPEPSAGLLLLGGTALLAGGRRRRKTA